MYVVKIHYIVHPRVTSAYESADLHQMHSKAIRQVGLLKDFQLHLKKTPGATNADPKHKHHHKTRVKIA